MNDDRTVCAAIARSRLHCALNASHESRRAHVFHPAPSDLFVAWQVPLIHALVGATARELGYTLPPAGEQRSAQLPLDRSLADWAAVPLDAVC